MICARSIPVYYNVVSTLQYYYENALLCVFVCLSLAWPGLAISCPLAFVDTAIATLQTTSYCNSSFCMTLPIT